MADTKVPGAMEPISISQAVLAPLDAIFKAQIHAARSYINMLWQMAYPHIPLDEYGNQISVKTAYEDAEGNLVYQDSNDKFFYFDQSGKKMPFDNFVPDPKKNPIDINTPYMFPLKFKSGAGDSAKDYTMAIPTIAMVPITPLGVEKASISFDMSVSGMESHQQLQESEKNRLTKKATVDAPGTAGKDKKPDGDGFDDKKRPWYLVNEPKSLLGSIQSKNSQNSSIHIEITLSQSPIPAALEKSLTVLTQSISVS